MKLAAEAKLHNKEIFSVSISQLLLLDYSFKGSSRILHSRLSNNFIIPPIIVTLDEIVLSDSYINTNRFLSDANKAPAIKGDILELKPLPDKECFDYGFMFSSGIDGKPFAVFIDAKSGRQYRSQATDTKIVSGTGLPISEDKNFNSLQRELNENFQMLHKATNEYQQMIAARRLEKHNTPSNLSIGDLVVRDPNKPFRKAKLNYYYRGPYEVRAINNNNIELKHLATTGLITEHIERLKFFKGTAEEAQALANSDAEQFFY